VSGIPLDPHHAAFAGRKGNLDLNAVVGRDHPAASRVAEGGIRPGSRVAGAVTFSFHMTITIAESGCYAAAD